METSVMLWLNKQIKKQITVLKVNNNSEYWLLFVHSNEIGQQQYSMKHNCLLLLFVDALYRLA